MNSLYIISFTVILGVLSANMTSDRSKGEQQQYVATRSLGTTKRFKPIALQVECEL